MNTPHRIINSLLDMDLYKFTVCQVMKAYYPNETSVYKYNNRNHNMEFNFPMIEELKRQINSLSTLAITADELKFLKKQDIFKDDFLNFINDFRFDPTQVSVDIDSKGQLNMVVGGNTPIPCYISMLWEVVLMAIVSELYFAFIDRDWNYEGQQEKAALKILKLNTLCMPVDGSWMEFGTRRRRSYKSQEIFFSELAKYTNDRVPSACFGTSNMHFAHRFNIPAKGTVGHEWYMLVSGVEGVKCANKVANQKWLEFYGTKLNVALTDTFGTEDFFKTLDKTNPAAFSGLRQDSGTPEEFITKAINHYSKHNLLNEEFKRTFVFSDGLDIDTCWKIIGLMIPHCKEVMTSFGIGTYLTNDYNKISQAAISKPLNQVIKLNKVNATYVVKISDTKSKAIGDYDALKVAKWELFQEPLNA